MNTIKLGIYRHYKGKLYEVSGIARHSKTEKKMKIYSELYGDYGLWVRPADLFAECVEINGQSLPRFECIKAFE